MMFAAPLVSLLLGWTAAPRPLAPAPSAVRTTHAGPRMDAPPTLREQMLAYVKSVQERGMELTPEQKAVIAEFEGDDELLAAQVPELNKKACRESVRRSQRIAALWAEGLEEDKVSNPG